MVLIIYSLIDPDNNNWDNVQDNDIKEVARIEGTNNEYCENIANELYGDTDQFCWKYDEV
jgi:hypothetical protein